MTARASRRTRRIGAVLVATMLAVVACGTSDTGTEARGHAGRADPDPIAARAGRPYWEHGATELYRAAAAESSGNVVVAPWPLVDGLAMVQAGAAGEAADELGRLIGPDASSSTSAALHELADRQGEVRSDVRRGRVDLTTAVGLWAQRGTIFSPDYLDRLAVTHGRGLRVVDFRSDPEGGRGAVNRWTADMTGGRVPEVAPRGSVTPETRLLLATALWFEAPWDEPFDPDATREDAFTHLDGTERDVATMRLVSARLRAAQTPDWEAIELPYLGRQLTMVVIAPAPGTFSAFEAAFDAAALRTVLDELEGGPVDLRLPRFAFTDRTSLVEPLRRAGLESLVDTNVADLTGISADGPLALDAVVGHAYAAVDEEGTAATAATVQREDAVLGAGVTRIAVDRPFLFVVRDRPTGVVIQIGRVVDPAA